MKRNSQPDRLVPDSLPRTHMRASAPTDAEAVLLQDLKYVLAGNLSRKLTHYADRYAVRKLGTLRRLLRDQ